MYASDASMLQCESLVCLDSLLHELNRTLSQQSRTARLWLLYMKYVDLVKLFLLAERMGNFLLHLQAVHDMLPLFAATGIQIMQNLPVCMCSKCTIYLKSTSGFMTS